MKKDGIPWGQLKHALLEISLVIEDWKQPGGWVHFFRRNQGLSYIMTEHKSCRF